MNAMYSLSHPYFLHFLTVRIFDGQKFFNSLSKLKSLYILLSKKNT